MVQVEMPEEGRVVGTLRRGLMRFRKFMPVARVRAGGATCELRSHAAEAGYQLARTSPHPPIVYEGVVAEDGTSAVGTWSVQAFVVPLSDRERVLQFSGYRGTWAARRASERAAER